VARLPPRSTQLVLSLSEPIWARALGRRYTGSDQNGEDRHEEPSALSTQSATRKNAEGGRRESGGVDRG
jgi:hypothetical protein